MKRIISRAVYLIIFAAAILILAAAISFLWELSPIIGLIAFLAIVLWRKKR